MGAAIYHHCFLADTDGDDGDYGGRPESGDAQSGVCVIL